MRIIKEMVQRLINEQCPQFMGLEIKEVAKSGHDNRTFHLGNEMIVRLPSDKPYARQADKENKWLPYLSKHLSLPISKPIYLGQATSYYPYPWSILEYLKGDTLTYENIENLESFAVELRDFLNEFQSIDCQGGPIAGVHNFYRGGNLSIYHEETIQTFIELDNELDIKQLEKLWQLALSSTYQGDDVWVHGDIAPGNLLIQDGHLSAVIDFGILGIGDPACDYAIAWTFFNCQSRQIFLKDLSQDMINRAMGWALWKALITYHSDDERSINARYTLQEIMKDYEDKK